MKITTRWFVALVSAGICLGAGACRADDFDFPQDSFFSDHASTPSSATKRWHLRLGAGLSILAGGYEGNIPPLQGFYQVHNGNQTYYLYTGGYSSVPLNVDPDNALAFEGSILYDVTRRLSIGLMGGLSTGHTADVSEDKAFPGVTFYFTGPSFPISFRYELKTAKVMPMVQYGPRYPVKNFELRPYVMGAAGAYKVDQNTYVVLASNTIQASGGTKYYSAAAGGFGLGLTFSKIYTVDVEGRYERVLKPGQTLAFWIPTVQFGYIF